MRLTMLAHMENTLSVSAPAALVQDLSVFLDTELSMNQHTVRVTSSCLYHEILGVCGIAFKSSVRFGTEC